MRSKFIILFLFLTIAAPHLLFAEEKCEKTGQPYTTSFLTFRSDLMLNCVPTKLGTTICIPTTPANRENLLVTFGAKIPGSKDNLKDYKAHLKNVQTNRTPGGKEFKSQVNFLKDVKIDNVQWVDALHKEGELENYYTRYLATVHNGVAVVFAVTIAADKYKNYSLWLKKLVNCLRVLSVAQTKDKNDKLQKETAPPLPKKEDEKKS